MAAWEIAVGAVLIVISIAIVILILLQQSKSQGLSGAIAGGAETFFGKNKGRTLDAKLNKITKVLCAVFIVLAFAVTLILGFVHA